MIKLFRKTRKRLLAENKFSRYLIYAVGEIILVVIGILIALKVNNYNIQELNNEKFETIFHEVKENIIADIKSVEIAINYYNTKDSLIQLVRNDKVTKQMYLENRTLFYLLYYYRSHSLHDNGYNMLSQNLDVIPQKYDTVMPYLNRIYSGQRKVLGICLFEICITIFIMPHQSLIYLRKWIINPILIMFRSIMI